MKRKKHKKVKEYSAKKVYKNAKKASMSKMNAENEMLKFEDPRGKETEK